MAQECLTNLAILSMGKTTFESVSYDDIIDQFMTVYRPPNPDMPSAWSQPAPLHVGLDGEGGVAQN